MGKTDFSNNRILSLSARQDRKWNVDEFNFSRDTRLYH